MPTTFCINISGLLFVTFYRANQPACTKIVGWSCRDECKYSCMWQAVDAFQKDGLKVPQFHGKVQPDE